MRERVSSTRKGSRVLITGTGGFIAPRVAGAFLDRGYEVFGLDKRVVSPLAPAGLQHRVCDLIDRAATARALKELRPDIVLHLAARTDLRETRDIAGYAANFEGVASLCEAIAGAGTVKRAICTSSQLVHAVGYQPKHEDDFNPKTLYGESKVLTEREWRRQDGAGTEWSIVRPTTIWGPGMNPAYLAFFRLLRTGWYFHVGGAPLRKSYGYVGNTAEQYLALAEAEASRIHRRTFYLADYEPIVLQEWAEEFRRRLGGPRIRTIPMWAAKSAARAGDALRALGASRVPLTSFRLKNIVTAYLAEMHATRDVCPTLPYSMREGISETVAWLRPVLDAPTPEHAHG